MWAYKIWEISTLWKIVNHKYWFLTAIWNQHLALFWGIEKTKIAKCEIAESVLKNDWILYVNWNNENIQDAFNESNIDSPIIPFIKGDRHKLVKYWNAEWSDAQYSNIQIKNSNTQFDFNYKNIQSTFEIPLIWEHHVLNITGVITCCIDLWLDISDIKKYLHNLEIPKNTLEITRIPHSSDKGISELILIDDTYNLSEAGLIAWLWVLDHFEGEKILVMDDILELGKSAEKIHYELGKKLASEKGIDKVLFCGVNYKKNFVKWFGEENIVGYESIHTLQESWEQTAILFEWRKARTYLEKLKKQLHV